MEDYPVRKNMRLPKYDYAQAGYYFVTVCTEVRNKNILASISPVGGGLCAAPPPVRLTAIGREVDAAIQKIPALNPGVTIDIYCIMPDHVHFIVALEAGRDRARPLPDIIGRMKSYTDKQHRDSGAPFGPHLWQEGYYDHILRNDADLSETRQYIQNNPIKEAL